LITVPLIHCYDATKFCVSTDPQYEVHIIQATMKLLIIDEDSMVSSITLLYIHMWLTETTIILTTSVLCFMLTSCNSSSERKSTIHTSYLPGSQTESEPLPQLIYGEHSSQHAPECRHTKLRVDRVQMRCMHRSVTD